MLYGCFCLFQFIGGVVLSISPIGDVAELVDAADSKTVGFGCGGSIPLVSSVVGEVCG